MRRPKSWVSVSERQRHEAGNHRQAEVEEHEGVGDAVARSIAKRLHLRTTLAAVVAAGLHRHREVVRAAEGTDEERYQDRHHRLCALEQIPALEVGAAGLLCLHNLIRFLDEDRDKTECDRHHHRDFVNRYADLFQDTESLLQTVGELVRRGRQCHERGAEHEKDETCTHHECDVETLTGDLQNPELHEHLAWSQEEVEAHGDQEQNHDALKPPRHEAERHVTDFDEDREGERSDAIHDPALHDEEGDQEKHGAEQLHPRVQTMDHGVDRIVLS